MMLAAERIGDRGQRYVVKYRDRENPNSAERTLGYTNDAKGAEALADAWHEHPEGYIAWVVDREHADLAAD
jgi:hypothetical protein